MDGCTGTPCPNSPAASSCFDFQCTAFGSADGLPDASCRRLSHELLLEHAHTSGTAASGLRRTADDSSSETGSSGHPAPPARKKRRGLVAASGDPHALAVQQWPAQRMIFSAHTGLVDSAESASPSPWKADPSPAADWGSLWQTLEAAARRPTFRGCPEWRALLAAATHADGLCNASGSCCASVLGSAGVQGAPAPLQVWPTPVCF